MKSLGLDTERLQTINPGVLFFRLDCLGGPKTGQKLTILDTMILLYNEPLRWQ